MIFLIHESDRFLELLNNEFQPIAFDHTGNLSECLTEISNLYSNEFIIWCHVSCKNFINKDALNEIFHHRAIMASYCTSQENFISNKIGYVDRSVFIKLNKKVKYPTWLMSSDIGGCHAELFNKAYVK